jgi:hypothetical protein
MWEHQHKNDNLNLRSNPHRLRDQAPFTSIWPEGFTSTRIYDDEGNLIEAGRLHARADAVGQSIPNVLQEPLGRNLRPFFCFTACQTQPPTEENCRP